MFALGNNEFWKQFKAILQHRMRERGISFFLAKETLEEEIGARIIIFEAQLLVTQHHAVLKMMAGKPAYCIQYDWAVLVSA